VKASEPVQKQERRDGPSRPWRSVQNDGNEIPDFFHPLVLSGQPANLFVEFLNLSFILLGLSAHFSIFIFKKQVEITGCIGLPSGKHVGMDVVVGSDFV